MSTPVDDNTRVGASPLSGAGLREISNKYEVLSQIGQGGMGTVYKVRHTRLDNILALKVLQPSFLEGGDTVARFYREARMMARLKHPNIAQVIDIDRDDALNFYYFVMEYVEGQTLRQYLRERKGLPPSEVLSIARQVAKALAYAHAQTPPVIHRDIKPSNIMIEESTKRVVVMDFGIAKELIEDSEVTRTGAIMGTLQYCAPEQMRHEQLDGATDIYALGMVMYEAYTGDRFFAGMTETQIVGKVLYDPQDNLPDFSAATPQAFTALVTKAIAKSRQQRYQRIADFLHDLEACQVTLRESPAFVVPPPVKLPIETAQPPMIPSPAPIAQTEEQTVAQRRSDAHPSTSQSVQSMTRPVAPKTDGPEKGPPFGSTKTTRKKNVTAPDVELTMGHTPPEIIADMNSDRWAIGETHLIESEGAQNGTIAPAPRRRVPLLWLSLLGVALLGGLVFFLKPRLAPPPPRQPTVAAPVITRVEPQTSAVRVLEGEKVAFATQADGAVPLQYAWLLDGQVVSQTENWTYSPVVGDRSDTPKDVRVQITDRQGQVVERHWQVTVTYISQPPVLQGFAPKKGTIEVTSGTTQPFRVDVVDPDRGEQLTYAWTVNGEAAGAKATLNWNAPEPGNYQVRAVATDPSGLTVSKDWQVKVVAPPPPPPVPTEQQVTTNNPPQITRYAPDEALITTQEGQSLSFSATVSDPDGDQLAYEWSVDGKRVARGSSTAQLTLTWKAKGAGNHVVRTLVSDRAGLTAMREWQVAVVPASPSANTPAVNPPVVGNSPPQITGRTPDTEALKTSIGQNLAFEATATDPDGDDLTYEWFVNGKKAAQGKSFSFAAVEKGDRQIELRVIDTRGARVSTHWGVTIGAAPSVPRVVMFTPHQKRYSTYPHLSRFFSIEVEVPGETVPELTYEWKVDGRAVRSGALFELKDQPVGTHEVDVTAITSSGERVSQHWTVEVRKDDGDRPTIWSPQLEIFDLTNTVSTDKKAVVVTGKLRNTDQERATDNVIVWVVAINGQGEEIARRMTLPSPQPIEPGRTATFQAQLNNQADAVDFRVQVISK